MSAAQRRIQVIGWLTRRARLDLEAERQQLLQTLSRLEQERTLHQQAMEAMTKAMRGLQSQLQPGQVMNLALYASGASHVEHRLQDVCNAVKQVERIEALMSAERAALMRTQARLQKLDEREENARRVLAADERAREQQQLDELWLIGLERSAE